MRIQRPFFLDGDVTVRERAVRLPPKIVQTGSGSERVVDAFSAVVAGALSGPPRPSVRGKEFMLGPNGIRFSLDAQQILADPAVARFVEAHDRYRDRATMKILDGRLYVGRKGEQPIYDERLDLP